MTKNQISTYPLDPALVEFQTTFPALIFPDIVHDHKIATLHMHDCLELGTCIAGEGIFVIANKVLSYKTGDVIFINDREPHRAQSREGVESVFSWVYLDVGKLLAQFSVEVSVFDISPFCGKMFENVISEAMLPDVHAAIVLIVNELREVKLHYQRVVRSLVLYLMLLMYRHFPHAYVQHDESFSSSSLTRINPALSYICINFNNKIEISALASLCSMSIPHFRRIFYKAIGKNPLDYLLSVRLAMACLELKSSNKSADHIAAGTGFPTFSCFLRKFKSTYGITPHQWRRNEH